MSISQDFINAVKENDLMMVHIMLKDSLVVDPTLVEWNSLISYAEDQLRDLYDVHDGEIFVDDVSLWTKDYMDEQMVNVVGNFSKERIELLKNICKYLYSDRAEKIERERIREAAQKVHITQTHIGTGVAVAGVVTAAVGIAFSKPLIVGAGVVAAVAGGILIVTDK